MLHVSPPCTPPKALKTHEKLVDPAGLFTFLVSTICLHFVFNLLIVYIPQDF